MGSKSTPKVEPVPTPPPVEEDLDPEIRDAKRRARLAAAAAYGRRSTILGGGLTGATGAGGVGTSATLGGGG